MRHVRVLNVVLHVNVSVVVMVTIVISGPDDINYWHLPERTLEMSKITCYYNYYQFHKKMY